MIGRRSFLGIAAGALATAATGLWSLLNKQADDSKPTQNKRYEVTRNVERLVLYRAIDGAAIPTNWWSATFKDGKILTVQSSGDVLWVARKPGGKKVVCHGRTTFGSVFQTLEDRLFIEQCKLPWGT